MKKSRRKIITLASLFLCCMAVVGVGFAAWVITGEDTETANGSITVDTVTDERYVIEVLPSHEATDTNVKLGGTGVTQTTDWLKYTGDAEDLEAVIVVEVKNYDKQKLSLTASITDNTAYKYLVDAKYIKDATIVVSSAPISTRTDAGVNYGTYTITITFSWGEAFNFVNPVTYYNGLAGGSNGYDLDSTEAKMNSDIAFETLNIVKTAGDLAFTLTVNAKVDTTVSE